ncbi:hypothetical protein SS50377_24128 [Spironucleus salmonicida]|nr:hypothetical protein SS50377_24128 [Spironucleus salmonicida]
MLLKFQVFNQMFSTTTHCALVCPDILILNFNTKSCIKVAFQSGPIKFYSTKFPDHIFIQSGYNVYLISLISQKVIKNLQISSPIQLYNNFITYQTFYDSEYCLSYIYPTNSKINILLKIDRHLTRLIHIEDDYLIIGRFDGVCQIYSCVNYDCQPFKL